MEKKKTFTEKNNIFKILTVIISSLVILSCFAACDKNSEVPEAPTVNITTEAPETEVTDEVTTEEGTLKEEEPTVELPTEEDATKEDEKNEDDVTEEKTTEEEEKVTEEVTSKPVETTTQKTTETTTKKPVTTTEKETTTKKQDTAKYTTVNQTVYATENVNIRNAASTSAARVGGLKKGQSIKRIAIGDNGWSKVELNGTTAYVASNYLTTTKPVATTTTKPVTTTKKPVETTTQKPVETTTKKPAGSATQTSGGISLKPITSSTAKAIANSWSTCSVDPHYEGKSSDGKTIVVYAKTPAGWTGRDSSGAFYSASGEKKVCEYCTKTLGIGNNMCRGNCAVSFN